jgi:hypothetical protein
MGKPTAASASKAKEPLGATNNASTRGTPRERGQSSPRIGLAGAKGQPPTKARTAAQATAVARAAAENNATITSDSAEVEEPTTLEEDDRVGSGSEVEDGGHEGGHEAEENGNTEGEIQEAEEAEEMVDDEVIDEELIDEGQAHEYYGDLQEQEAVREVVEDTVPPIEPEGSTSQEPSPTAHATAKLESEPESHVEVGSVKASAPTSNDIEDIINLLEPAPIAHPSVLDETVDEIPDED